MVTSLAPVRFSLPFSSSVRCEQPPVLSLNHHGPFGFGTRRSTSDALQLHSSDSRNRRCLTARAGCRRSAVSAEYHRGGGDFVAGFLLGGAVFGTLAYVFAPQMRRSLLNEDEDGFRRAKGPIYYEDDNDGLEKARQSLNAKLRQLNTAIDNVSSRLRGGNDVHPVLVEIETDQGL